MLCSVVALLEVATDVGGTVVVTLSVEDFNVDGGTDVTLVLRSNVDDSTVVLGNVVALLVVTTDVGSIVVVTAGVEDFKVVENSVVACSVLGIDSSVVVMPAVET